jgi:hypothetical protein
MSVAAGLAVMAAMFEAEISQACGPKGKHDAGRAAVRPRPRSRLGHVWWAHGGGDPAAGPHPRRA